jgi:ureidoglycolate lyase
MEMLRLIAKPLTAEAFAPYGEVLEAPAEFGRAYIEGALANGRPNARPSLSFSRAKPVASLPLKAVQMERHEFSSQSFVPMDSGRWLVIVAPKLPSGGPDASRAEAFLAAPGQGVTYGMNVWHHPLSVIDAPIRFAIFMWLERSKSDEEFVQLEHPFEVALAP